MVRNNKLALIFFIFLFLILLPFFGSDIGILLPLFGLCASSDGCGNTSGGDSAGTDGGNNGNNSTPFLYTWTGDKFTLENDVLFGKPNSSFSTYLAGRAAYEAGLVTGDTYQVKNPFKLKNGKLSFQIKELEPEESYFDYLSLTQVLIPKEGELFVRSDLKQFEVFETKAIGAKEGIDDQVIEGSNLNQDIAQALTDTSLMRGDGKKSQPEHIMQTGNIIKITATVSDAKQPLYLFLGSRHFDWIGGLIPELEQIHSKSNGILSPFQEISVWSFKNISRASLLVLMLAFVWATVSVTGLLSPDSRLAKSNIGTNDLATVNNAFRLPQAQADHGGRSLEVSYYRGNKDFQKVDIIEPRYYQKDVSIIQIPAEAIEDGKVTVQVMATKRHAVTTAFLAAPKKKLNYQTESLSVKKALKRGSRRNWTKNLNTKYSKQYLHTIPGDVVDIEFKTPTTTPSASQQEVYLLHADGFYTPATQEAYHKAKGWIAKLDPESQAWLKKMYAIKGYKELNNSVTG